ncbi:PadR family transcriptional regulator [Streptomyces sp. NPDC056670]|uniref:PadR family transcriptional regulator n=1 Tax=Streptomyces sp. NPDC056670 TaxID=3345904 RepID=UPI0036ACBE93
MTTPTRQVLAVLSTADGALYGLQIARRAGLGTGTVYPILHRLLSCDLVKRTEEQDPHPGRPPRRFYELIREAT